METTLQPETKIGPRILILVILMIPIMVAPSPKWWYRIVACIVPFMLTGTFRIARIEGDKFRSQLFVAFLRVNREQCNLAKVHYLETKYNSLGFFFDAFPIFKSVQFFFIGIFDLLMPALGGAYEIWLVTGKGREIVAWQGFHEKHFSDNLALLKARSGAEIRVRGR